MKALAVFLLFLSPVNLASQSAAQTFTSPAKTFRFRYSPALIHCHTELNGPSDLSWAPDDCSPFSSVCDDPAVTIVCFAYPKSEFQRYPTFEGAAFAVSEIKSANTEKSCLAGSSDWENALQEPPQSKKINGNSFNSFEIAEGGLSHSFSSEIYRGFHAGRCFQLSLSTAAHSASVYDPPVEDVPAKMWARVDAELRRCLYSFQFLD